MLEDIMSKIHAVSLASDLFYLTAPIFACACVPTCERE